MEGFFGSLTQWPESTILGLCAAHSYENLELRLPDQLKYGGTVNCFENTYEYTKVIQCRLTQAHKLLRSRQEEIITTDTKELQLFKTGDLVWMISKLGREGENIKPFCKHGGSYHVVESLPNHTCIIERDGKHSTQPEHRLKIFRPCSNKCGCAPVLVEPKRRPNMKGTRKHRKHYSALRRQTVAFWERRQLYNSL